MHIFIYLFANQYKQFKIVKILSALKQAKNSCKLLHNLTLSDKPPSNFIAGRPKAAHLFWFFGDFRCGALLLMLFHVIYKYKNR